MGTSFNNQWVLARARSRRRERAAGAGALSSAGDTGAPAGHERRDALAADRHHAPERQRAQEASTGAAGHRSPGFGPALAWRHARKHPRWIDRDT